MSARESGGGTSIGAGAILALISLVVTMSSFPAPAGTDAGGLNLTFLLVFPAAALGGTLLGGGLSDYASLTDARVAGFVLKLVVAAAVITGSLLYGVTFASGYFDGGVAASWYAATLGCTVLFAAAQEGIRELT
ncbi:MAG: hypothetical protein ABEJ05_09685 [Haloglomus sp.]